MTDENWDRKTRTTWTTARPRTSQSKPPPKDPDRVEHYDELLTRSIEREREALMREALWRTYCWTGSALLGGFVLGLAVSPAYRYARTQARRYEKRGS